MPIPSLVVGLGGTGTLVATYVKKELMETLESRWPPRTVRVIAFDTDAKQPDIGAQGTIRRPGQTTGAVRLETGEFFFIGGNVQTLMREVAGNRHPHLGSWLQADWYLRTLADKTFNLNEGAGQFRQFGRLAVFKDVAAPANSTIYSTLYDGLVKLRKDNPTLRAVQVFIIASLAGGTGAGMFADVAHLIREIAAQPNVELKGKMTIRGYLVLPEAFSQTVDHAWLRSMHARSYAAMRENRRFAVSFDYQRGYPMHYHSGSGGSIWNGALKGKLFDLIYYLDGQGSRSPLSAVSIRDGIAPSIADAISAAMDAQSGPAFASYVANVEAERTNRITRGEITEKTATFGATGTYSIVFPIHHVVEGWTHKLGLDVLNELLKPTDFDPVSNIPTSFASNANREQPGDEGRIAAKAFLKSTQPVTYQHRDETGSVQTEQAEPTLLFGELSRIAQEALRPGSNTVQALVGRSIVDWGPYFMPSGADRQTMQLINKVDLIINTKLYERQGQAGQVKASDQVGRRKEDPISGHMRILDEVRAFKNRFLGDEDPRTGQRSGGSYRTALNQIVDYQVQRFSLGLSLYLLATLNGGPNRPAKEAKAGKLGFLQDFLNEVYVSLERTRETLASAQQMRREQGDSRRNALAHAQTTAVTMRESATKKAIFGRGPAGEAFQSQHAYLQAELALTEILQAEAAEDAILNVVTRALDIVRSAHQSIRGWQRTLGLDKDGLYAQLLRGVLSNDSGRAAEQDVRVRKIVSDPAYEDDRYRRYVDEADGGWVNHILGSLQWSLEDNPQGHPSQLNLSLNLQTGDDAPHRVGGDTYDDNVALWLQLCRQPFTQARHQESVIGYLMRNREYRDPTALATMIYANGGTTLGLTEGDSDTSLPANFLRAYFQTEEEAGHRAYLRAAIQHLAQLSGQSVSNSATDSASDTPSNTQENRFAQFVNSEDRFKLTLVFTRELIQLDRISSYSRSGANAYLGGDDKATRGDRRLLHVFPAEVHAAEYENRLQELKQPIRLFSDGVALQLEDRDRLRLFLLGYVYGLIERAGFRDERTGGQRNIWRINLPPLNPYTADGSLAQPEILWLTKPTAPPLMLEALTTFNFVGMDVRHDEGYAHVIDYDLIGRTLIDVREKDAQQRLKAELAGEGNPDLRQQATQLAQPGTRMEMLTELARVDRVRETQQRLETQTLPALAKSLDDLNNRNDFDIASVFALMLRDELRSVRQIVQDQLTALQRIPGSGHVPASAEQDRKDLL